MNNTLQRAPQGASNVLLIDVLVGSGIQRPFDTLEDLRAEGRIALRNGHWVLAEGR